MLPTVTFMEVLIQVGKIFALFSALSIPPTRLCSTGHRHEFSDSIHESFAVGQLRDD